MYDEIENNKYFFNTEDFFNLQKLKDNLYGKTILITDTNKNIASFYLAHIVRSFSHRTYCIDDTYKMTDELCNYRIIENGKVILIKGDIVNDKNGVYNIIKQIHTEDKIDLEIIINGDKYE